MNHRLPVLTSLMLCAVHAPAHALDIMPYSADTLATLQHAMQTVTLHFHAEWCSTCKAQEKVFKGWQGNASVPGTLLVVDFDTAHELRKKMAVRSQSTVISFKGKQEKARLAGDTDAKALRSTIEAAR